MIRGKDRKGVTKMLLEEDVDELWNMVVDLEDWVSAEARDELDEEMERLLPEKKMNRLVRQREELATLIRRSTERVMGKLWASAACPVAVRDVARNPDAEFGDIPEEEPFEEAVPVEAEPVEELEETQPVEAFPEGPKLLKSAVRLEDAYS